MPEPFPGPQAIQPAASSPPRVAITGATGMIGHALRAAVARRGWTPVPIMRPLQREQQAPVALPGAILWEPGSDRPFADPDALEGIDAVVHLAGASLMGHRWTDSYKKTIVDSRVSTTRLISQAVARLDRKPKVLISASAVGFYGSRGDEVLTEDSSAGAGFLAETCKAWEGATETASAAGIRVAHTRFGVVLSPAGGALKQMLPLFRSGLGGRLGSGQEWMSWITLDDLLAAILFVIETESLVGAVNIVAPNPVRNAEFTEALGKSLHRPTLVPAPAFALRTAFGEMADEALLASTRVLPKKLTDAGFSFRHAAIAPALEFLVGERVAP